MPKERAAQIARPNGPAMGLDSARQLSDNPKALKRSTMSHHCGRYETFTNRRDFLKKAGAGFGLLALADLLQGDGLLTPDIEPARALDPVSPRPPHSP